MNTYLDILSIFALLVFLGISLKSLEKGILFGILIKPLIDTSWDINMIGFSVIEIFSIIFLFIAFIYSFKKNLFRNAPRGLIILWVIAHLGVLFYFFEEPINSLKSTLKLLYLPIAFIIIPYLLLSNNNSSSKLLKYLLYGALFSSLISILQFIGIIPYEYDHMSKGLQRANGFYHDMVTSRIYVLQGFIVLAYILHSKKYRVNKYLIWALLGIFLVSAYTLFSKALIGIVVIGAVLLLFTKKQKLNNIVFVFVLLLASSFFSSTLISTSEQLFTKEIEFNQGEADENQLFSGRGGLWNNFIEQYETAQPIEQILGFGINSGRTHNEFLRTLILSGLVGFFSYCMFMFFLLKNGLIAYLKRSRYNFLILFILSILFIDSISVVWGLYPFYIFILIGFYQTAIITSKQKINATTHTKTRLW